MVQGLRLAPFLFFPPRKSFKQNTRWLDKPRLPQKSQRRHLPTNDFGGVVILLRSSRSHQEFQEFLAEQIRLHYLDTGQRGTILLFHRELTRLWHTDLSMVPNIVRFRYSDNGAPARDPVAMLRSLLLMEMTHCRSVDDWVRDLKAFPLWAILSGFDPGNVPGVGTFYDFMKRLWLADAPNRFHKVRKYRHRKPKKGERHRISQVL
jgi:hypothetical protein